jgi:DNA-binding NtrC family response regulator
MQDGPHVLVADDCEIYTRVIRHFLSKAGYRVTTTDNGKDAARLFEEDPWKYAVVMLDLCMPEWDGVQAWIAINRLRPGVPVLFCSGDFHAFEGTLPKGDYIRTLNKPFESHQLVGLIHELATINAR